ncbi:protein spitz, partial [Agrilus planipennis]|uniref:Protein spitz n=1 Tax=Agrilus planipennis TaxID=224129 RepID=A0A1W4XGJ2_AGRPL
CFCSGACSSRTTPKPRPPPPTPRPNITFHTYECPPAYSAWYCLNGATCFTVKIGESLLYNCECAEGYMGARCEFKDLDGTYLPSQRRFMLETASIAGGATIAVFLVVILCVVVYINYKRRTKASQVAASDCVDGRIGGALRSQPTFGTRWRTSTNNSTTATTDLTIRVHDRGDHRHSGNNKVELQQITTLLGNTEQPSKV